MKRRGYGEYSESKGKRADKSAEALCGDLTNLFQGCCGGQRELTEDDSFYWGLGYFRSTDYKLYTILYYLIITLQEQIYHFCHWLSHARQSDKGLDEDGVHRKALVLWNDLKKQNQNISMEGALVGAFAVIVQTLPSKPESCLVNKAFQTALHQAKMSEEAKAHATSSTMPKKNVKKFKKRLLYSGLHTEAVKFLDTISRRTTGDYDYSLQNGYIYFDKHGTSPWAPGPDKKQLPSSLSLIHI